MGFYEKYDVVIVGGGLAGLTSAAYLSRAGKKVIVCEKEAKAGGLVGSFSTNGFVFDSGIRAFENSGIILPMLRDLGIELDLVKSSVSIGMGNNLIRYRKKESLAQYELLLKRQFPENKEDIQAIIQEIKKVIKYMDVLYGIDNPLFVDYKNDKKYLFQTLLPWLLKYQINIKKALKISQPVNDYLAKFTKNSQLIDMITQHFFKQTPAFFALSYFGLYLDYSYPIGGTGVLVDKMVKFITDHGGTIATGRAILKLDPVTKEITSSDRTYHYQAVIWAADLKALYHSLDLSSLNDGDTRLAIDRQADRVNKAVAGDSIFTLYLETGQEAAYFQKKIGPHLFYTADKRGLSSLSPLKSHDRQALEDWIQAYLALTTYEISVPAVRDASLAPAGRAGLIVSTLMDYSLVKEVAAQGWYKDFKILCQEAMIKVLKQSLFADLTIENIQSSSPLTLERLSGNAQGGITGWAFTNEDIPATSDFPRIKDAVETPIPSVYQAGQWTFSPSGLPISILTGKLAADAVEDELKRP